jgi:hypothetical protein
MKNDGIPLRYPMVFKTKTKTAFLRQGAKMFPCEEKHRRQNAVFKEKWGLLSWHLEKEGLRRTIIALF